MKRIFSMVLSATLIMTAMLPYFSVSAQETTAEISQTDEKVLSTNMDFDIENSRTDDDTSIEEQWSYDSVLSDYAITAIESSSAYKNEVTVGVLDTGVDYTRSIFNDRIKNTTFNTSASGSENDCMDNNGHGTFVAGIIAL